MKQVKANLTRIKTLIEGKFPETGDIFEYPGVTRQLLIDGITECSGLVDALQEKKETLDVIILKREFAEISRGCLDYLNSLPNEKQQTEFNEFLKNISLIRKLINETFLLVVKESLRPESSLADIQAALKEIIPKNIELIEAQKQSEKLIAELGEYHKTAVTISSEMEKTNLEASQTSKSIVDFHGKVETFADDCTTWVDEIEENKKSILMQSEVIQQNQKKIKEQRDSFEEIVVEIEKDSKSLVKQIEKNEEFQKEIQLTIGDANRSSMAGSFKKRKDEIDKPLLIAESILVGTLFVFGGISLYLFKPYIGETTFNYYEALFKIPILLPFLWLSWFYTRKVGHLNRIQEDYAFKYAAAMAFEGYNKHCEENDELSNLLLAVSIQNMGQNPIRLYGKGETPSGPLPELISELGKFFKSIPMMGKKSEKE